MDRRKATVSFSAKVKVREYNRILEVDATPTLAGLAIGWKYHEQEHMLWKEPALSPSLACLGSVHRATRLGEEERLLKLREYGFAANELEPFFEASIAMGAQCLHNPPRIYSRMIPLFQHFFLVLKRRRHSPAKRLNHKVYPTAN